MRAQGIPARLVRTGRPLSGGDRVLAERLDMLDAVIELRGVPDEDLPGLYNAVDLLLFPSLYEGFGWPPLEAMASGTPVVCSRAGSLAEVVGDAALTADPENVEALTWHAAAAVLGDAPLRAALVARGLAHASQFTWHRTATQLIDVYQDVLPRRPAHVRDRGHRALGRVTGRPDELAAMTDWIVHRGPDDHGALPEGRLGVGMRRLSIVDLSPGGHQPMFNEDESVVVVFNGELYNHLDLRSRLVVQGHRFRGNSDTEVLVHGYEQLGRRRHARAPRGHVRLRAL